MTTKTFDDELHGVLFKNDRKENATQPDYTGTAQVNGTKYRLSAWIKEAKTGRKYLSLALSPQDDR